MATQHNDEGRQVARRLTKNGWQVASTMTGRGLQYTATHPDAPDITLRWRKGAKTQRLLDEAAAALGLNVRTTSGKNRKDTQARHREQAGNDARAQHLARIKALQDTRFITTPTIKPREYTVLTDTQHALERAIERGITGPMVQNALLNPVHIKPGYNNCVKYIRPECTLIIIGAQGIIVSIYPS